MNKHLMWAAGLIVLIVISPLLTKAILHDNMSIPEDVRQCALDEIRVNLDSPLENLASSLGEINVVGTTSNGVIVSERTLFGIEVGRFLAQCERGSVRLSK